MRPERIECGALGPGGEGPCIHLDGHVERGFRIHRDDDGRRWTEPRVSEQTWRERAKIQLVRLTRKVNAILDRIHAKEDERRAKRRARDAARKAVKK